MTSNVSKNRYTGDQCHLLLEELQVERLNLVASYSIGDEEECSVERCT